MIKEPMEKSLHDPVSHEVEEDAIDPDLIREELRKIVSSRHFQSSRRGIEFLQHVVNQKISGNGDMLKERLIGVEIFGRKPDYSTGEDPVVRVQAGDVRRRLERYHADPEIQPEVLIDIPLGSYAPVFLLRSGARELQLSTGETAKQLSRGADFARSSYPLQGDGLDPDGEQPKTGDATSASTEVQQETEKVDGIRLQEVDEDHAAIRLLANAAPDSKRRRPSLARFRWLVGSVLVCIAVVGYLVNGYFHKLPESATRAFWLPAAVAAKPVLLCLPRPMVYKPSEKLFDSYAKTHPGTFTTRESRQDQLLPLDNAETIQWGDMHPSRNAGPGIGGVIAAVNMSKLLTEQGIRFDLRFGKEATYAEMRSSPVLIIGGINTEWATQLVSESNFVFDESIASPNIHETTGAKRVWKQEAVDGHVTRDYGLITRQLSGKAGPFLVQVAGISHFGTAAASEILVQPQELEKVLRSESIDLRKKNLQIVISTDITDERAGPPRGRGRHQLVIRHRSAIGASS